MSANYYMIAKYRLSQAEARAAHQDEASLEALRPPDKFTDDITKVSNLPR